MTEKQYKEAREKMLRDSGIKLQDMLDHMLAQISEETVEFGKFLNKYAKKWGYKPIA